MYTPSDPLLEQYKKTPSKNGFKQLKKYAQQYWVIISLIVAIVAISTYALLNGPTNHHPPAPEPSQEPSDTPPKQEDPPYWISSFDPSKQFSNFTQVIIDQLAINFQEVDKNIFHLDASENLLNRQNWKSLFNFTEQIVKGMKLISLQDDVIHDKLTEFERAEQEFELCKKQLLSSNYAMETESEELMTANKTIAREEAILEDMKDKKSLLLQKRKVEVNKTNIIYNQKIMEKTQKYLIFGQTADKGKYLKSLQEQLELANQLVERLKKEILELYQQRKSEETRDIGLEDSKKKLEEEIAQIKFEIDRLKLDSEINEITGRVKREEHIQNTNLLIQIIQRRIYLINSHRVHNQSISSDLMETFQNDKSQLKDLTNLQINLIRSFCQQSASQGGKSLEELENEMRYMKEKYSQLSQSEDKKEERQSDYDSKSDALEKQLRKAQAEVDDLLYQIQEFNTSNNAGDGDDTSKIQEILKNLEAEIQILKKNGEEEEIAFQKELDDSSIKINSQVNEIKQVQNSFSKLIIKRLGLEKGILSDLNKCRTYRYMMNTIQSSANESQDKVQVTQEKLLEIKHQLKQVLESIIPDDENEINQN